MIEQQILTLLEQNRTIALVTIIDKSGSAPRLPGSKMIVEEDGTLHGTIGGGAMEHAALQSAIRVVQGAPPVLEEFDLRGSGVDDDTDMVCGGIQLVLIERITPAMTPMFQQAVHCFHGHGQGLWMIDITDPAHPGRRFLDLRDDPPVTTEIDFTPIMRARITRLITLDERRFVLDPLPRSGTVILFGGGHVSSEVAHLAAYADFEVIVCDDRRQFANPDRFPMAKEALVIENFASLFEKIEATENSYLLILTRGHSYDQQVLAQALQTPARYIGMIGSRRKRDILYDNLRQQGFGDGDFARVHCPVGLSIGSETPAEIAISIVAELIAARAGAL